MKSDTAFIDNSTTDDQLVLTAKNNPAAFRPLYEKYYKRIFLFVLHRTGEKEIAADVTSQVFLKAMMALAKFQFRGLPFSSWLYRIAINECNSFFRKNSSVRTVVLEDFHSDLLYEEMFGENTMEELKQKLPRILQKLTPDDLQFIELRFLESRPFKEVAEILNVSETHAKVKTYRILDKLKKLFFRK